MDDKAAEAQSLIRTIQVPAIPKAVLQSICAVNGIPKTGNKSDLQRRIIQRKSSFFCCAGACGCCGCCECYELQWWAQRDRENLLVLSVSLVLSAVRLIHSTSSISSWPISISSILPNCPTTPLPGCPTHLPSLMGSPHHRFVPWLTFPAEINLCTDTLDWERLQEIRESIVTRAPIFIPPALVPQAPSPSPRQSLPASQPRSQALPQSSYYQPAARPQTPPNYAMAQFGQSGYGALNGLRSQNPPAHPFPAPQGGQSARSRPNGLVAPTIAYKSSPFYELKYQIGDVKTLEGASAAIPPPPLR